MLNVETNALFDFDSLIDIHGLSGSTVVYSIMKFFLFFFLVLGARVHNRWDPFDWSQACRASSVRHSSNGGSFVSTHPIRSIPLNCEAHITHARRHTTEMTTRQRAREGRWRQRFNCMRFWSAISFSVSLRLVVIHSIGSTLALHGTVVTVPNTIYPIRTPTRTKCCLLYSLLLSPFSLHSFWSIAIKSKIDWKNSSHGNRFPFAKCLTLSFHSDIGTSIYRDCVAHWIRVYKYIGKHFVIDRKSFMKSVTRALVPLRVRVERFGVTQNWIDTARSRKATQKNMPLLQLLSLRL